MDRWCVAENRTPFLLSGKGRDVQWTLLWKQALLAYIYWISQPCGAVGVKLKITNCKLGYERLDTGIFSQHNPQNHLQKNG